MRGLGNRCSIQLSYGDDLKREASEIRDGRQPKMQVDTFDKALSVFPPFQA